MLLDNLLKMGTFKVDGGLNFKLEDNTLLKVNLDVTGDIADAQVGDYVKLETTSTTTPSSCTGAYVKLDKEWIAFPTGD